MDGKSDRIFAVVIILFVMPFGASQQTVDENALFKKLFRSYHANLRPVRGVGEVVNVTVDLGLTQIINMDERHQVLKWNGWVRQIWHDYRLAWNLADFGNIEDIAIDKNSIWTPDMALYNNAKENFQLLNEEAYEKIVVHNDGNCLWMVPFVFTTTCKIDVTHFPFDEQVCEFEIGSWAYTGAYLNILYKGQKGDLSQYSQNSAWEVLGVDTERKVGYYSCCPEPFPSLIFKINMRRRSLYYMYKIIIPSCLIAVLAILSFFLPTSSGERVTLLITNFVSLTLFILMLSAIVPPTSDTTPILEVYLTAVFIEISAALILRCSIDTAKRQNGRPSLFIRKFVCYYLARLVRVQPLSYDEATLKTSASEDALELENIDLCVPYEIEVVRTIQNSRETTGHVIGPIGAINNNGCDEGSLQVRCRVNKSFSVEEESDESEQKLGSEFRSTVLNTLETVSDSVRQKRLEKIRQRENRDIIATLDKFFFWLFTVTISSTVAAVFLIPPTLVL